MVKCTKLHFFLGLVGTACVITFVVLLSHKSLMSTKMRAKRFNQQQEQRKELLREVCDREEAFSQGKKRFENLSQKDLAHFMVDDNHGIVYCFIPKVASSSWKRFMVALNKSQHDPMSFPIGFVHHLNNLNVLYKFSRADIKAKLKHYTKFLFVRDPFVRLISAYRNKFDQAAEFFYKTYGREFLRLYRNQSHPPDTYNGMIESGVHYSFANFMQYLTDPRVTRPFDEHWMQMYKLCHPCAIRFDFIGHLETLKEDAEQLLEYLKLEGLVPFPSGNQQVTTTDYVLDWFKTVPLKTRRKLYKLYEADFKLFSYPKPQFLLEG